MSKNIENKAPDVVPLCRPVFCIPRGRGPAAASAVAPRHGPFEPDCLSPEKEQAEIVEKALPELDAQLSEDLLFDALWDRVLDAPARDLLVRAGMLSVRWTSPVSGS